MNFDVASAREYAEQGRIQEWVVNYLGCPEWANISLRDLIESVRPVWIGPIEVELNQLLRVCGPEPGMRWPESQEDWGRRIDEIVEKLKTPCELPPLIVHQVEDTLYVDDGNHRLGAMLEMGWETAWVLIWRDK